MHKFKTLCFVYRIIDPRGVAYSYGKLSLAPSDQIGALQK
jgi:hypothetical protein